LSSTAAGQSRNNFDMDSAAGRLFAAGRGKVWFVPAAPADEFQSAVMIATLNGGMCRP
jgi:hypothetical protein